MCVFVKQFDIAVILFLQNRSGRVFGPQSASSENLVPEQADEVEENCK